MYTEDNFTFFFMRKPVGKTWEEAFVIIPLIDNPDLCLVSYFSTFKTGVKVLDDKPLHGKVESYIQDQRMKLLLTFRKYINSMERVKVGNRSSVGFKKDPQGHLIPMDAPERMTLLTENSGDNEYIYEPS